jgi:hypothetical protein
MLLICRVWLKWKIFVPCTLVIRRFSYLTPHTSHPTPHTPHFTPHTPRLTPHTSHPTPHTPHLTPHTSHLPGDVYVFIKLTPSSSGSIPHVYLWKGSHSSPAPLLAWSRFLCRNRLLLNIGRLVFDASVRKLKADTLAKYGKFASYQEMAQGRETPDFTALFKTYFVVYEGRLAAMFCQSAGTLKHKRSREKAFGSNIFLVRTQRTSFLTLQQQTFYY